MTRINTSLLWLAACATLPLSACLGTWSPPDAPDASPDAGPTDGAAPGAPPDPTAPPTPAVYKRGSLVPPYQLTPRAEYGRFREGATIMGDLDFETTAVTVSAVTKLDEIAAQIAAERGVATIDIVKSTADRDRASLIPFRGNPSDVKLYTSAQGTRLYVPLGGDVMTPGNEVAVVTTADPPQVEKRIKVGVRPQRLAVHTSGLVFVCNQYSNYISIIDARTGDLLTKAGAPIELPTEYLCADVAWGPRAGSADALMLYVANRWRHSVLAYALSIVRDASGNVSNLISIQAPVEILGVGRNPFRLTVVAAQQAMYVANNKGGELARVDLATNTVTRRIAINAPAADVLPVGGKVFVPTTTIDRGLLWQGEAQHPAQVDAAPLTLTGLDGASHVAHPGAMYDGTRSYNFEDLRNGLLQFDAQLAQTGTYYTDDVSSEPNYVDAQKVLAGALPSAIARNSSGDRLYVALAGSDLVQELKLNAAAATYALSATGLTFKTQARPFALAVDGAANRLYVANWGGETVEIFNLSDGTRIDGIDLGYAEPAYPATNMERGEYFYYNATWSNNKRKSCATCHFDELDTDGVGFANGATAPTAYHQVKPNHNLATTDSYFWNGSFSTGTYRTLAFAAQTRTNCELVEFGFIEGPASNPSTRVGDKQNTFTNGQDANCRPVIGGTGQLPSNQAQIDAVVTAEKALAAAQIKTATGIDAAELSRIIDAYSVSELRLPPNPLRQLDDQLQLGSATHAEIELGKTLFTSSGCAGCHVPGDARHPFADGRDHGSGADWVRRFIDTYKNDARITDTITTLPQTFLEASTTLTPDADVVVYRDNLDAFIPFCYTTASCLEFDDPLASKADRTEESRRLDLLITFNLGVADREFVPGNVRGQIKVNTPSLRGVWTQANLLHHGLAHSVGEAILAPGHPGLLAGEQGFAVDSTGKRDVHGLTSGLTPTQVAALLRYVESIE